MVLSTARHQKVTGRGRKKLRRSLWLERSIPVSEPQPIIIPPKCTLIGQAVCVHWELLARTAFTAGKERPVRPSHSTKPIVAVSPCPYQMCANQIGRASCRERVEVSWATVRVV